jgi:hypothetical protein
MEYLLLIYHNEKDYLSAPEAEKEPMYAQYRQLVEELAAKGNYRGGHQLTPTSSATTVRLRDGKRVLTDGPFAETKEQLGGYFLVDAKDLDEAIAIAAKMPAARHGSIEVRAVVVRQQAAKSA